MSSGLRFSWRPVFGAVLSILLSASGALGFVKGFTITEIGNHVYDASGDWDHEKTEAQQLVDQLYALGVRHINLTPTAVMRSPWDSYLILKTPSESLPYERLSYLRLIQYIHRLGMTVGIRPIFFVVDSSGNTPFIEYLPGGGYKVWWHGNIQPNDPELWFRSFEAFLETYAEIATEARVEEFTVGAELQSMTVGAGPEWPMYPLGFPARWNLLIQRLRAKIPSATRLMYDVNYTDAEFFVGGESRVGGELAAWRYHVVDLANPVDPVKFQHWEALKAFWRGLDAIGIDMYRSLAEEGQELPIDYQQLVSVLGTRTSEFARDLDQTTSLIAGQAGKPLPYILKEVGYKSVDRGFINPFEYAGTGQLNVEHQAAAYEALLAAFNPQRRSTLDGIVLWDASVSSALHGPFDRGFSPIGKSHTEEVLRRFFGGNR